MLTPTPMSLARLLITTGIFAAVTLAQASAMTWSKSARDEMSTRLAAAAADARTAQPAAALRKCTEAKSFAAPYDRDVSIDAKIDICFGLAALYGRDRDAACAAFARAVARLTAEPEDDSLDLEQARRAHSEMGCP